MAGRPGPLRAGLHGEWLAANIPGARLRLIPDEGHFSIKLSEYGNVLDDLVERGA